MKRRNALKLVALGLLTTPVLGQQSQLVRLTGKLVIPAEAGTKNSYLTGNFQLITQNARLILTGSRTVSDEQLEGFRDQWVSLEAVLHPAQSADSNEQAPIDPMSGETMSHPASYEVRKISAYKGKPFKLFQH